MHFPPLVNHLPGLALNARATAEEPSSHVAQSYTPNVARGRDPPPYPDNLPRLPSRSMSEVAATRTVFTAVEREYIRRELDMFLSSFPTIAEGFQLKTWRGGSRAGQPKLPPAAISLLERGLMRLDTNSHFPRLFFTDQGMDALRVMMADRRLANPERFAHIRQELGL